MSNHQCKHSGHAHDHGRHDHHAGHHHHHAGGNLLVAFFLNLGFAALELIGGLYTGSIAILSDALHDAGDCCSLGLAWYLERLSARGRDQHFSYGYKRFSLLSALVISLVLLVGSIIVIISAVGKVFNPEPVDAGGMFILAIFGVLVNGYAAYRMLGSTSLSDKALRLHLLEDVLGWVAVLIVSVVMYFVDLPILDPLLSIGISCWILYNVYFNLRDTFRILLQGVPEGVDSTVFIDGVRALPGVLDVHDLHVWTMNGEEHIASLHVVYACREAHDPRSIVALKMAIRDLAAQHQLHHITIELDPEGEPCGLACCPLEQKDND